jgi:DNA polymerase I-like protein with 3'-5' exonuclease and polymerase domains
MPIIQTEELAHARLDESSNLQTYCGLDCCLTLEIFEEINAIHPQPTIYSFERALQAPYLEIMFRGFAIDEYARRHAAGELRDKIAKLRLVLNEFASAIWDNQFKHTKTKEWSSLNAASPTQLKDFFYSTEPGKRGLCLPEIWLSQKGERKLSVNREALEKIHDQYLLARPIVNTILAIRDYTKQVEIFETEIDSDGRFRASYNIAGTETGRPSSSRSALGTGRNGQNIAPGCKYPFVADPGYKLCVIDLEQVEARDVGFICGCLFDDWTFLDACESGDLHTNNCKLIWPELPWTGDKTNDRKTADRIFYRDFTYRDMAKRGGHLTNYFGTAWTMSRSLKIPLGLAEEFQARYCRGRQESQSQSGIYPAYPCIPKWWQWTATQLQTTRQITTPFGRRRHFFGRPGDDTTLREAIAFLPQSMTAERMNLGLYRIWEEMPHVQLLAQTFDSVTFQFLDLGHETTTQIINQALRLLDIPIFSPSGRRYSVPGEAKIGYNWGYFDPKQPDKNPLGLAKFNPAKPDLRVRGTGLQTIML